VLRLLTACFKLALAQRQTLLLRLILRVCWTSLPKPTCTCACTILRLDEWLTLILTSLLAFSD